MAKTTIAGHAELSPLQQSILRIALRNREAERRGGAYQSGADVYYVEVLVEHFGFETRRHNLREFPSSKSFDRGEIGRERYNAASAALSRSVRRLEDRGLGVALQAARGRWGGMNLTAAGIAATLTFTNTGAT